MVHATNLVRNRHGHLSFTLHSRAINGLRMLEELQDANVRTSRWVKSCLRGGYDVGYKLDLSEGRYRPLSPRVVLMPTAVISSEDERTTPALRSFGEQQFGYTQPFVELIPRIARLLSPAALAATGFREIGSAHVPIWDMDSQYSFTFMVSGSDGIWIGAHCESNPKCHWNDRAAIAMFDPGE